MNNVEFASALDINSLVAVIRATSVDDGLKLVNACCKGGIKIVEITFTVPKAESLIKAVAEAFVNSDIVLGAGTVLNVATAKLALLNGAKFIVSPNLNLKLLKFSRQNNIAYAPGILTPTELAQAVEGGAEVVKLFPGDIAKPQGLKSMKAPFPNVKIMPTGGVDFENLEQWFKAGAIAVGAGSNLTSKAKLGDYDGVIAEAEKWIKKINEIKGRK
ncbi:MAG: bifunctional 2-keto-4-hydroxyglutarate aldolase/2-keto-3-deoxy-6-phosphogluconate aldolase [Clostridia bacterium]